MESLYITLIFIALFIFAGIYVGVHFDESDKDKEEGEKVKAICDELYRNQKDIMKQLQRMKEDCTNRNKNHFNESTKMILYYENMLNGINPSFLKADFRKEGYEIAKRTVFHMREAYDTCYGIKGDILLSELNDIIKKIG